jgi:protein-tyrosine phosphatase
MIDLHCHILPAMDDGAADLSVSLEMARAFVADGVEVVACTPHILPGLYHNDGPAIRAATDSLQQRLQEAGIRLQLTTGADVHVAPDLVRGLRSGQLLTLGNSRYLLVEPPHHVLPARLDERFFQLQVAGYVPILTHPERLTWIREHYALVRQLAAHGVWMQITSGSLLGQFGKTAAYWAERMLCEGLVHLLATDAHDERRRPPCLREGRDRAERLVGADEADHLVWTRPLAVIDDSDPSVVPAPAFVAGASPAGLELRGTDVDSEIRQVAGAGGLAGAVRGVGRRLRQLLD